MKSANSSFNAKETILDLKKFLPAQAPLKDFIFHNTLKAFQDQKFHEALRAANEIFGYEVYLPLKDFRMLYDSGKINKQILEKIIVERKGDDQLQLWLNKLIKDNYKIKNQPRVGFLREKWKTDFRVDLDVQVHPLLFRIICSFLDQGISIWNFPIWHKGFLPSIREMERKSGSSFFKTKRARNLLINNYLEIEDLLKILVGDETLFKQYLFDQQFAHQGWSGMVSFIEDNPNSLIDERRIKLYDFILFELLLEIDAIDFQYGEDWLPLENKVINKPLELFSQIEYSELNELLSIWQDAYEWTYYDEVLAGINTQLPVKTENSNGKSFQALFCIDDRECSIRRFVEQLDTASETFGTPGFFNVEFFYQPQGGKFYTKLCPAPVTPKYLIKEIGLKSIKPKKDEHFLKQTHSLLRGWIISQTLGFWSAFRLFVQIFRPSMSAATATSLKHMDKFSELTIENINSDRIENNLQIGFTHEEMTQRVEGLLKSIGLVKDFAPIVYVIGHGSSSVNNPYYATMDCGACSCRPGSVNARVISYMANHPKVREALKSRGIFIPEETQFLGGLHDTGRDEMVFYDEKSLSPINHERHEKNKIVFLKSLDYNAKERSRRFESIDTKISLDRIHKKVMDRTVSLFEPRPELDHATNALCIVGRRELTAHLFLDRRAFLNSYDYKLDPQGTYLFNILKAAAPVCGGINLAYYFSRVDNKKLGAGTKLPHNVMGLFGVANGADGDLRPGIPNQMIEIHDPLRILFVVEHFPEVVLETIQKFANTYEWFINEWVNLIVVNPDTQQMFLFKDGKYSIYKPLKNTVPTAEDIMNEIESSQENLPVFILK